MVENSELALEKKMSQVQNSSLPLPGGMAFTSLFYVLKSHFIICKIKYNNTSFYIIGIWWGLNKKKNFQVFGRRNVKLLLQSTGAHVLLMEIVGLVYFYLKEKENRSFCLTLSYFKLSG